MAFKIEKWTPAHQEGFETAAQEQDHLPFQTNQENTSWPYTQDTSGPILDWQMKRFFAAAGFVTLCVCLMFAAKNGALDSLLNIIGCSIAVVAFVAFTISALKG